MVSLLRKINRFLFAPVILCQVFLPSCMRNDCVVSQSLYEHERRVDIIKEYQAKRTDIPFPIHCEIDTDLCSFEQNDSEGLMFGCYSIMDRDQIIRFYSEEMERLGWQQVIGFVGVESLLSFDKPDKTCVISIRSSMESEKKYTIILITGDKEISV